MIYEQLEDLYLQTAFGKVHYKRNRGSRQKLIFLHGLAASSKSFERLITMLPNDLEIYLLDLLGHGESEAPHINYTIAVQTQVVSEFIRKLNLDASYIFGHSYGAWIAAKIAEGNFRGMGIVLEDAVGLKDWVDEAQTEDDQNFLKEAMMLGGKSYVIESAMKNRTPESYLTKESLGNIVKPALIVWGKDDERANVKFAKLFSDSIRGSLLEIINGAKHTPHYTHAPQVKELLMKFINYF